MKYPFEERLKILKSYLSGLTCEDITGKYGVNKSDLFVWVARYQKYGDDGLMRHPYTRANYAVRKQIVKEHLEESVSLTEISAKHGIARSAVSRWCKIAREQGYQALSEFKHRGRPPKDMGRPKKQAPQTEIEILRERVKDLEAENALLKKVKALVKERDARLKRTGQKPSRD
ncbi:MAG: helix-turn-helix domain-containing protein [Bacteroidales bacterium]|jgi:transposase-like protein|nr:helix-turn-helix domain-containing protein [Bacteroidales bacterium]